MECKSTSLADVLTKDFLSCGICSELYKIPKLMLCLHTYCQECLSQLVKGESLQCPDCQLAMIVKDGVSSLKTNVFIESLVDLFQSQSEKVTEGSSCSSCQKSLPSALRCLDCGTLICSTCANSLACSCPAIGHRVVDLKDLLTRKYNGEPKVHQEASFQDHEQLPVHLFCDACSSPVCKDCNMLDYVLPTSSEAVLVKKQELMEMIDSLALSLSIIPVQEEELEDDLERLPEAIDDIKESIQSYVTNATALLLKQQEAIVTELDLFLQQKLEQHLQVKQEFQCQKENLISTKDFAQKLVDVGKDLDIEAMEDAVKNRMRTLQQSMPKRLKVQVPELALKLDEKGLSEFQHFSLQFKENPEELNGDPEKPDSLPRGVSLVPTGMSSVLTSDIALPSGSVAAADVLSGGQSLFQKYSFLLRDSFSDDSDGLYGSYDYYEEEGYTDEGETSDGDWYLSKEFPPVAPRPTCVCTFDLNQLMDFDAPKITGVTVSSLGDILMCDQANDDIKWFSPKGVEKHCTLPPEPDGALPLCGVAMCGDILACSSGCFLLFLTVKEKLLNKIYLRGSNPPYAIAAYKSRYVAVSEGTLCSVSLYSTNGHCVGRVQPRGYHGGKFLFIAINSSEVFIVSDFFQKQIVLFEKSGEIVNILDASTPLLREPFSLCVDLNDHIYVVDQERILEFTPDGEFGRVIIRSGNGFDAPRVIAVDRKHRLIVVHKQYRAEIFQLRKARRN